jgi:hypothetical protein
LSNRILIASEYNAKDRAHFAQAFEFCSVVASCDAADIVAPGIDRAMERRLHRLLPHHDGHNVQRDFNRLMSGVRKGLRLKNAPTIEPVTVTQDYEVFFFVAWSPQSLVELTRMKDWRKRCKVAVAYLFELWTSTLKADRDYLKLLDQFDHVFLLHSKCIPRLASYTRAPCSVLPVGIDCVTAAPCPRQPARVVDVYSIGNRSVPVHQKLLAMAREGDFFYVYDSLASTDSRVGNWAEHRSLLMNTVKRSRYFIGFSPASLAGGKTDKVAGEQVLPGRLFEGAAGGAVILGSAPRCPEFDEFFDWPDAVIEVAPDGSDLESVMDDLDTSPDWVDRVQQSNIVNCLQKHDWAYRWEHILATIGIEPLPPLSDRKARLSKMVSVVTDSLSIRAA